MTYDARETEITLHEMRDTLKAQYTHLGHTRKTSPRNKARHQLMQAYASIGRAIVALDDLEKSKSN
jgi:hypothetical protein